MGWAVTAGLMPAFDMIVDTVGKSEVFKRHKTPLEKKVLAAMLCFAGLSYRKTAQLLGGLSYMAVQRAFTALRDGLPKPERKYRGCIAVDETKLIGEELIVWAAWDLESREVLAFRCSFTRSYLDAELFLKDVLQYCMNRPLFLVEKGPWYPYALKNLGLRYEEPYQKMVQESSSQV
ncbi:MAG: IS6 family transposase [archaeon]|nr:IS6 family transposase [archaeon]MCP8312801.1 IS6 family transposase [archaeon]